MNSIRNKIDGDARPRDTEPDQEKMMLLQQGINTPGKSLLAMVPLNDKLRTVTESIIHLFDADFAAYG